MYGRCGLRTAPALFFMDFSTQLSSQLGATSRATPLYLCFEN